MLGILHNIPNLKKYPLHYIFEDLKLKHEPNTLWLEFGVYRGSTINYISKFTEDVVYGFDSFQGLPEKWRDHFDKGAFNLNGVPPQVNKNVELIIGLFQDTLIDFLKKHNKKINFIHIDCDLYTSTKFILNATFPYLNKECIVLFDELINYPGFDGETGEFRAFYEFTNEKNVKYKWLGMNGSLFMTGHDHEKVAVTIFNS